MASRNNYRTDHGTDQSNEHASYENKNLETI